MKTPGPIRNDGMDLLRTLAIVAMMAAHTSRLIVFDVRQEWSRWVLLLEPLIPSMFLFLVGLSLVQSRFFALENGIDTSAWFFRQARRSGMLWLISILFFSLEEGVRFPDVLFASGILCSIGYAVLLVTGCLASGRAAGWLLGFMLALGSAAFILLDRMESTAFLLVAGNSPVFPLLLFALAGALWGLGMRKQPRVFPLLGVAALFLGGWLVYQVGVESLFTKPLGRSDATRILAAPFYGGGVKTVPFYNLKPLLALACIAIECGLLTLAQAGMRRIRLSPILSSRIFSLGRHGLENYVLHLFLLGLLVVGLGPRPLSATWQGNATLLGIAAACQLWSMWRERRGFRYRGTQSRESVSDSAQATSES